MAHRRPGSSIGASSDDGRSSSVEGSARPLVGLAESILDAIVEAVLIVDPSTGRIKDVNRGAETMLGHTRDELVGERINSVLAPGELVRFVEAMDGANGAEAPRVVLDYRSATGSIQAIEVTIHHLAADGSLVAAVARGIDERIDAQIRLQRLAQVEHARAAELNAVIRAMGDAVIVCTDDGTITLANPAAHGLFPDVKSRTYADIVSTLVDPLDEAPLLGRLGGPVALRSKSGPERWLELSTYPVTVGIGLASEGDETIVVIHDITASRRREAVRDTFIGVLSHELRTPVTTIFGGAKLLARERSTLDEATRREIFRDIHDEADRLQRLVEDVVAMNRFGEEAGEVGSEPVLLQRLLPRVVSGEEGRWPGVGFQLTITPALPTVSADPTYVEQVIRNLLSNAAKYGGAGSVVSVVADLGDHEVEIRVLDDGPGFPADEADQLFELFYRSPDTASMASGAGIGLFVCARLIAAMGGRIWARPRPEGGAEFGFALAELDE